jgi:hypothetical protein
MKTNEAIFAEIREQGYITEAQIKLLKNRSNREEKDLFDYTLIEEINDGYGVPITSEQGAKGLAWLQRQARRHNTNLGYREIDIIEHATANDFTFRGFYDASHHRDFHNFQPLYELNGMEYVALTEPYVVG